MRLAGCGALLASFWGLASAGGGSDSDACVYGCDVRVPDKIHFPERGSPDSCVPLYIGGGGSAPAAVSSACLDFAAPYLTVKFAPFAGYTTNSASVTWKVSGKKKSSSGSGPTTTNCHPGDGAGVFTCKIHFGDVLGVSPTTDLKALVKGMCPRGVGEGLDFELAFSGEAKPTGGNSGSAVPFSHLQPAAKGSGQPAIKMGYRCSTCKAKHCSATSTTPSTSTTTTTVPTDPPPVTTCVLGTAFGYQGGHAVILNAQSGNGCNRWGWYMTPSLAELHSGISGILYVGVNGNDVATAVNVGDWTAIASPTGGVTITYSLDPGYFISEANIDFDCLPIDTCLPSMYVFRSGALPMLPVYVNPTPIQYPACSGGSQAYLIIHAVVQFVTATPPCPAPVAT